MVAEIASSIPLQRYGTVQDIANAGVFLFSEAASYVTGSVLIVDGGEVSAPPTYLDGQLIVGLCICNHAILSFHSSKLL